MAVALTEDMAALIPSEEEEDDVVEVETAELKGSATADYIPVEEGELAVRKGEVLYILEQTLDGTTFVVRSEASGKEGKIPIDYIDIDASDIELPPHKPPTSSLRRRPAFMRSKHGSGTGRPRVFHVTPDDAKFLTSLPAVPHANVDDKEEEREERRSKTLNVGQVPDEFKLIEKYSIVSIGGTDRDGRAVIVFSMCRLPPSYQINHQRLYEYLIFTLDRYVEQDYTLLYFHHGFKTENKPSLSWMLQVYRQLDRKYKKNLKKWYIVHPTNFVRVMMWLFKPVISYKFGKKVAYINRLSELEPVLYLDQIDIPQEVLRYDKSLKPSSSSTGTATTSTSSSSSSYSSAPSLEAKSKSTFHMPMPSKEEIARADKVQFGVSLEILRQRNNDDPIPKVMKTCVTFLRSHGLDVLGIFRRTPSTLTVQQLKEQFNRGEDVMFSEHNDPHLAAVLMKLFLRELPEPLMTFDAYSEIVSVKGTPPEGRMEKCRAIVHSLPKTNYGVLKYLISFVTEVVAMREANKMSAVNMAIVLGPNLVWSQREVASLSSMGDINTLVVVLIENYEQIFTK